MISWYRDIHASSVQFLTQEVQVMEMQTLELEVLDAGIESSLEETFGCCAVVAAFFRSAAE